MTIRKILLAAGALTLCVLLNVAPGRAEDGADPLAEANARYRSGDFAGAVEAYRAALKAGWDGARIHYNLGNALYRSGHHAAAIAHWLAARRMAPRDPDVRANLELALARRPQGPPAPSPSWLHAAVTACIDAFTLSELAVAATVLYWLAIAVAIVLILQVHPSRSVRRLVIGLALLATVTAALALGRWWRYHRIQHAVVVTESAVIRTGPCESFETVQTVTEGWLLRVLDYDRAWTRVIAEGGARGWISTPAIRMVPRTGGYEEPG